MSFTQEGALFETAFSYGWEILASQEKAYFQKLSTHLAPGAKVYLYVPDNRVDSITLNASDYFQESGGDGLWNISIRGRGEQTQDILHLVSLEKKLSSRSKITALDERFVKTKRLAMGRLPAKDTP